VLAARLQHSQILQNLLSLPQTEEEKTPADYHTLVKSELDAQDDFVSEQQEKIGPGFILLFFFIYFWPAA